MIRQAHADDAGAIAALEREAFAADPWTLAQVESELAAPTRRVLIAQSDRVQGYVSISVAGDVADLTHIVVAESEQRCGVGAALLSAAHDAAAEAGTERVLLEVAESNAGAIAFYAAHGYAEITRRRGYYANGDDALVMARALGSLVP